MINQIYHLKEATVKISPDWLKQKSESVDMIAILKGWWSEGNFRGKPANAEWKNSKFRKTVQIVVILLSRLFGRKDGTTFPDKWIPIIYQIMTSGATLNWGELISSNLENQLKRVQKEHLHVHISNGCNVCQPGIPITRVEMGTEFGLSFH